MANKKPQIDTDHCPAETRGAIAACRTCKFTGGGPSNKTEVFPLLTYHLAMRNFRLGEGAAVPILMLPILATLILVVSSYMEREAMNE